MITFAARIEKIKFTNNWQLFSRYVTTTEIVDRVDITTNTHNTVIGPMLIVWTIQAHDPLVEFENSVTSVCYYGPDVSMFHKGNTVYLNLDEEPLDVHVDKHNFYYVIDNGTTTYLTYG